MRKITDLFKKHLIYVQFITVITIAAAFIPALNPIVAYDHKSDQILFTIFFKDLGSIMQYFQNTLGSFSLFSRVLYVMLLFFYVGFVCYVCGLILTFAKAQGGKRSIFTGSIIFIMIYLAFFAVYFSINRELYINGSELIQSKWDQWRMIPIGIYVQFFLALINTCLLILGSDIDFKAVWYRMRLNWIHRFNGGVHPTPHKNTRSNPIETLLPQKEMIYPLLQHIGAICVPCVKVGDYVKMGQIIADSTAAVSVPIHASVSGTVKAICEWDHPTGNRIPAIIIENDFEDNAADCFRNGISDYKAVQPEDLIEIIRNAGIVGMGGAAFPTHIKLTSAMNRVDTLIVNAAECEPYLSSDHRVMLESTDQIIEGIRIVKHILNVKNAIIGIENNKPDAISCLHKKLNKSKTKVIILKTKYPQGGEKQLIRAVTGRVVPAGKLPVDVGCVVLNVDTVIAIYNAVVNGSPLMRRIVTVAGHGVERVGNVHVRIGTPFKAVLDHFGWLPTTKKLIMGGPMMGTAQYSVDAPVIKSTSGLICMTKEQLAMDRDVSCIRCGSCVSACPMYLVPSYIAQYVKAGKLDELQALHAGDCIECGCCSFICPAKIPLIQYIRIGKQKVNEMQKKTEGRR